MDLVDAEWKVLELRQPGNLKIKLLARLYLSGHGLEVLLCHLHGFKRFGNGAMNANEHIFTLSSSSAVSSALYHIHLYTK